MMEVVEEVKIAFGSKREVTLQRCFQGNKNSINRNTEVNTSVIRTFALRASAFRGSRIKSDVVSPVKATSGYSMVSVT
jgi:hypothetical protein